MKIAIICGIIGLIICAIGIAILLNLRKYMKRQGGELSLTEKSTIRRTIILCSCIIGANIMILIGVFLSTMK